MAVVYENEGIQSCWKIRNKSSVAMNQEAQSYGGEA